MGKFLWNEWPVILQSVRKCWLSTEPPRLIRSCWWWVWRTAFAFTIPGAGVPSAPWPWASPPLVGKVFQTQTKQTLVREGPDSRCSVAQNAGKWSTVFRWRSFDSYTDTHTDTDTACLTCSVDVVLQRKGDSVLHHQAIYFNWNLPSNWTDPKFGSSFCEFISTEMFSPALPRSFSVYFFKLYHKLKLLKIY